MFHPSNKYLFPKPCTINNVSKEFPQHEHKFQEFFHIIQNSKQTKYVFVVTMLLSDVELKQRMKYYLASSKLYMNSTAIDANTLYTAGWIENLKPELANFKSIKEDLLDHFNQIKTTELDETQKKQLNEMTEPIHFAVRYGIIKIGPGNCPLIHRAPVITCDRSQRILLMSILSKVSQYLFGNGVGVIVVNMKDIMHNNYYKEIVSRSIEVTS